MTRAGTALILLLSSLAAAEESPTTARKTAETYLRALVDSGDDAGKQLLLGGVTSDAQLFTVENWKIVSEDPVRDETGDLQKALARMKALDHAGHTAIHTMMGAGEEKRHSSGDDISVHELSASQAKKLMAPTDAKSAELLKYHPVFAYVARIGKPVYWHKQNPIRPLLAKTGGTGTYHAVVHRYVVESTEGEEHTVRHWPLRVVRFSAPGVETGWKILPAADWGSD